MECIDKDTIDLTNINTPKYIPDFLELKTSNIKGAGIGVFTKKFIKKGTYIGNYLGELELIDNLDNDRYGIYYNETHYISAQNVETSNFTRFINCSSSWRNENILFYRNKSSNTHVLQICFFTKRDIYKGEELLVYYGHTYALKLGIDYHKNIDYITDISEYCCFQNDGNVKIKLLFKRNDCIDWCTNFIFMANNEPLFRKIHNYLFRSHIIKGNVIDLGAYIGDNTIPWAKLNSNLTFYAIDPSLDNCEWIKIISKYNNIINIKTIQTAIGDKDEYLYTDDNISHCSFVWNNKLKSQKVKATSLDKLYKKGIITDIGYIHLDVEGMEYNVLIGANELINNTRPIITFETHSIAEKMQLEKIVKLLKNKNYVSFEIQEILKNHRDDCRNHIAFPMEIYNQEIYKDIIRLYGKNCIKLETDNIKISEHIVNIGITINNIENPFEIETNALLMNAFILYDILSEINGITPFILPLTHIYKKSIKFYSKTYNVLNKDDSKTYKELDLILQCFTDLDNDTKKTLKSINPDIKFALVLYGNPYYIDMSNYLYLEKENKENKENKEMLDIKQDYSNNFIGISPHFKRSQSYVKMKYKNDNVSICPFIWEPYKMQSYNAFDAFNFNTLNIGIFEGNILPVKTCIIPMYIAEKFECVYPNVIDKLHITNCRNFINKPSFIKRVRNLNLYNKNKIVFTEPAVKIYQYLKENRINCVISNQIHNELNYLYLELMYLGIPIIHNSPMIQKYGYYYEELNIDEGFKKLEDVYKTHIQKSQEYYKLSRECISKFSIKNKENIEGYKHFIFNNLK
jgi:FkbM family methyltransferase